MRSTDPHDSPSTGKDTLGPDDLVVVWALLVFGPDDTPGAAPLAQSTHACFALAAEHVPFWALAGINESARHERLDVLASSTEAVLAAANTLNWLRAHPNFHGDAFKIARRILALADPALRDKLSAPATGPWAAHADGYAWTRMEQ